MQAHAVDSETDDSDGLPSDNHEHTTLELTDDQPVEAETDPELLHEFQDLTSFKQNILRDLASVGGEAYGLRIKEMLEERYGKEINHGRLYPNLDGLVEADYIEKTSRDQRSNNYALTEQAKRVLRAQLADDLNKLNGVVF